MESWKGVTYTLCKQNNWVLDDHGSFCLSPSLENKKITIALNTTASKYVGFPVKANKNPNEIIMDQLRKALSLRSSLLIITSSFQANVIVYIFPAYLLSMHTNFFCIKTIYSSHRIKLDTQCEGWRSILVFTLN